MPPGSLAIDSAVSQFRQFMWISLAAGTLAGLALFALQHWTVQPLIVAAEAYEVRDLEAHSGPDSEDSAWQPSSPLERNAFTAMSTTLSGIGFAAVLFAVVALFGSSLTAARGALWGLAGYACFSLAPALGLPPVPPGVAAAGLQARQLWWVATVLATATGLALLAGARRHWLLRIAGVAMASLPHVIGAPEGAPAAAQQSIVPEPLIRQFTIASLASQAVFWILLGAIGGYLFARAAREGEAAHGVPPHGS